MTLVYLHKKNVLIAIMSKHIIVYLGHNTVLVLPVDVADIVGADLVLVLDAGDKPRHCGGHQVQGGVHLFRLLQYSSINKL